MPNASNVKAGGAYVEISADNNPLTKGLNAAASQLKNFGNSVSAMGRQFAVLGAAITAPLIAAAKLSAGAGASIYDMSRRTGIGTEALQGFAYAAEQTGTDISVFEVAIKRMQKSIAGVKDEFEGTTGKLSDLGIAAQDIVGQSPDKQFELIAQKIGGIADPTERAAAAMSVFGRSGTAVLPLIERLAELQGRAKSLGLIRSDEDVRNEKALQSAFADLKLIAQSLAETLTASTLPVLNTIGTAFLRGAIGARRFASEHPMLLQNVLKIGVGLSVAGVGLIAFGRTISFVATSLRVFVPMIGLMASGFSAAASGVGLITVGLASLGAYALYASGAFDEIGRVAKEAFSGIADALASGDIKLAAQILWTLLQEGWLDLKIALDNIFEAMAESFVSAWIRAVAEVKKLWEQLKTMADQVASALVGAFDLQKAQANLTEASNAVIDADKRGAPKAEQDQLAKNFRAAQREYDRVKFGAAPDDSASKARIKAIEDERDANLKALEAMRGKNGDPAERERLEQERAELEKKLAAQRQQAASGRANAPNLPSVPGAPGAPSGIPLNYGTAGMSSGGIFNPTALFGLAGGGNNLIQGVGDIREQVKLIARSLWGKSASGAEFGMIWV